MGKGIELAKELSPETASVIDDLKDQLLIVFLKRLGGRAVFPLSEVDDTQNDLFTMKIDSNNNFHFEVINKGGS